MLKVRFFKTENGAEPVRDWLKDLSIVDKKIIGCDIKTVQYSFPMGKPLVASLGNGLWEIRSRITDGIARVIFFEYHSDLILLHGFIKKTQKTPIHDIDLAISRKNKLINAK
ncbi:MAG: type II toxin-antitoxin system RelE/ParE family toxin [Methylococcales bacterium]|nr:type II toxin-antitoxin system RelE/ParE family toxin [Methylococcales bacterium]